MKKVILGLGIAVGIIVIIYFITRTPSVQIHQLSTKQLLKFQEKDTYMRRIRPISSFKSCNADEEEVKDKNGNIYCYDKCRPGFKGNGDYCFLSETEQPIIYDTEQSIIHETEY